MSEEITEIQSANKNNTLLNDILDLLESVLFSVFIVIMIFTFLFRVATVEGTSMENTLIDKDKLIVSDLLYQPKVGDVVIIDNTYGHVFSNGNGTAIKDSPGIKYDYNKNEAASEKIVKRIIATAGQEVNIDFPTGKVYVDGNLLTETYTKNHDTDPYPTITQEGAFEYPVTVPDGYVFVLGDNRRVSKDSRNSEVGFISEKDIIGKVLLRIYPFNKFGSIK